MTMMENHSRRIFSTSADILSELVIQRVSNNHSKIADFQNLCSCLGLDTEGNFTQKTSRILDEIQVESSFSDNVEKYRLLSSIHFGKNQYTVTNRKTFLQMIIEGLHDYTIQLLIIAGFISVGVGLYKTIIGNYTLAWTEGVAILLAVFAIVVIGAFNQYSQDSLFRKLEKKKYITEVKTITKSKIDTVNSEVIVVGDTLIFEPGDVVVADCIIYPDSNCACDESLISGESRPVYKNSSTDPFLLAGSYVIEGSVRAIVVSVGKNSTQGLILESLNRERVRTPLENKVSRLAKTLAYKSIGLSAILFIGNSLKIIAEGRFPDLEELSSAIVESISIVVMAVPEGLPMAITIALSIGTQRMLKDGLLVRQLAACETMNNTTMICTDKTGTLTQNSLKIKSLFAGNNYFKFPLPVKNKRYFISQEEQKTLCMKFLLLNGIVNSSAFANSKGDFVGSRTEIAILRAAKESQVDFEYIRKKYPIIDRKPFCSRTKYMSSMIEFRGQKYVFFKGAPEKILKSCVNALVGSEIVSIDQQKISNFQMNCDKKQIRTLALSYCVYDPKNPNFLDIESSECTFLGIIGLEDPLRLDVLENVFLCRKSGIIVVMLTGDKLELAEALAARVGILEPGHKSLTGPQFRSMSKSDFDSIYKRIRVIARATPEDKKKFVEMMREKGHVVAVTGDGTNDGPALKAADIGFGMGESGTEIAKAASSIILTNDNFHSITRSIEWGRCINASVRKFIQFQLSVTYSAVIIATSTALYPMHRKPVMNPLTILWINMIMDTLAVFALSTDKPVDNLIKRTPEPLSEPIITSDMKIFIVCSASYLTSTILLLHYFFTKSHTFIFNTYVYSLIANQINARSLNPHISVFRDLRKNPAFFYTSFVIILVQFLITQFFNELFKTTELSVKDLVTSAILGITIVPYMETLRYLRKKFVKKTTCIWRRVSTKIYYEIMMLKAFESNSRTTDTEMNSDDSSRSYGNSYMEGDY